MSTSCRNLAVAAVLLALVACGDAASQDPQIAAARKYDQALAGARKVMAEVAVAEPAANRASAEALRSAANACKAPAGATNAQKAAFSLTAAQLLREAARLDAVAIERLQAEQRSAADQVLTNASSAAAVRQMAGALTAESTESTALLAEIEKVRAEIAESESAMQEAQSDVQSRQAEAAELGQKAAGLDRDAASRRTAASGAARSSDAEKLIREASDLTSQSIEQRRAAAAAAQVVQLRTPETALLQRKLEALKAKLQGLESDRDLMKSVSAAQSKARIELSTSTGAATERVKAAAASLEKVSGELKALYASAGESLEQAASLAQQGSSLPGPQGSSAKMSAASAHLASSMLNERAVIGLSMDASAFDALAKSTGDAKWTKLAEEARQERQAAGGRALAALEAAEGDLGGDAAPSLTSLKARIAEAKKPYEAMKPAPKPAEAEKPAEASQSSDAPKPTEDARPAESAPAAEPAATPTEQPKPQDPPAEPAPQEPAPQPAPGR